MLSHAVPPELLLRKLRKTATNLPLNSAKKPKHVLQPMLFFISLADFGLAKMTGPSFDGTLTLSQQVMGSFEVRTTDVEPSSAPSNLATAPTKPTTPHDESLGRSLVMLYQTLAVLLSLTIPAVFLMGTYDLIPWDKSKLWGVMATLGSGFIWAGLGYFRILVGAGPGRYDDTSIERYQSTSKLATAFRLTGLLLAFSSTVFFVLVNLDKTIVVNNAIFAATLCGFLSVAMFVFASLIIRFLRKNSRSRNH